MQVFLDANILFSAARSNGAIRELLRLLQQRGHSLVADTYVVTEARRNTALKSSSDAVLDLEQLLTVVRVQSIQYRMRAGAGLSDWLPEKDRPVLDAAIGSGCDALVTGDKTHFGPGYGKTFGGVTVFSPAMLAMLLLDTSA